MSRRKKTPRLTNSRRPEDLSRSGLRLSSLNLDSPSLVDSSGAWDLTHSALLTNLFPYSLHSLLLSLLFPCCFLLSSVPYSLHFPTSTIYFSLHLYCLHISTVLASLLFTSTLFTSLLSSHRFFFTSLLSIHLCSLHISIVRVTEFRHLIVELRTPARP